MKAKQHIDRKEQSERNTRQASTGASPADANRARTARLTSDVESRARAASAAQLHINTEKSRNGQHSNHHRTDGLTATTNSRRRSIMGNRKDSIATARGQQQRGETTGAKSGGARYFWTPVRNRTDIQAQLEHTQLAQVRWVKRRRSRQRTHALPLASMPAMMIFDCAPKHANGSEPKRMLLTSSHRHRGHSSSQTGGTKGTWV